MSELWLVEAASDFWEWAGGFKTDFGYALQSALPLVREPLAHLDIAIARGWLAQKGYPTTSFNQIRNRPLRACLVIYGGDANFIFLDSNDAPDDQLFSLAHEVAHFILDYLYPRERVSTRLAEAALEVLDGVRSATLDERLLAALEGIKLAPHTHFMERDSSGDILSRPIQQIEQRADQLALELLAPQELALPLVQSNIKGVATYQARISVAQTALAQTFNLPQAIAKLYAVRLVEAVGGEASFVEWLNS